MLNNIARQSSLTFRLLKNFSSVTEQLSGSPTSVLPSKTIDKQLEHKEYENNILNSVPSKVTDISQVYPYLRHGSVLASYVNSSDLLQELLKLGVNFYNLEKNLEAIPFILTLKFENIREHILFLTDLGLKKNNVGDIITKNPFILKEDLENLNVRINYLMYKKFCQEQIVRILQSNPMWLTHKVQDIDKRLGFFQHSFNLSGEETRTLAAKRPKLITYKLDKVNLNTFALKEEMGFDQKELKSILLKKPKIYMIDQNKLLETFDYLHNVMGISLERIVETPEILTCRSKRLKQRHLFLSSLNKAQYDPRKPNYVALTTLISGTDSYFSTEVVKSSIQTYNAFLKSL